MSNDQAIHDYWPSTMHMGDCDVCGNVADHPLHRPRRPLQPKQGDLLNDRAILVGDALDTGMSAAEAVKRAGKWWDETGRKLMMGAAIDPLTRRRSRMLQGRKFAKLGAPERAKIVKHWHHFHIRRGSVLDLAPDARFLLGGEEAVQ